MRSQYGSQRRHYLPTVPKSSGGSYRPRSYGRPHDFRYEREPQLKAPKEIETHYTREERIPEVRPNPYRPERGVCEIARTVHESPRSYPANEHKRPTDKSAREYEVESSPMGTETGFDGVISGLMSKMGKMKLEPTVESAEAILWDPTDRGIDAAPKAPELCESYEYPAKDLELLMSEIDAILLEPETKANQEVEKVENAERPL